MISNPGVFGARFRGENMFVTGLTGLKVYDISDPEIPTEIGSLDLPHFENEDVDLGGDILLISNDAAESTGILYIIDISDPTQPGLRSQLDMGGNPVFGGPGHTASCILKCTYAWVTDGGSIRVIDLRDPDAPVSLGTFPSPVGGLAMHDVQTDQSSIAWVAGYNGTAAYRITKAYKPKADDPESLAPKVLTQTNEKAVSTYEKEFGLGEGDNYNDFIHHNSFRRKKDNVLFITEEDYTRPTCKGAGSFQTWKLPVSGPNKMPTGAKLTPISKWQTELLADQPPDPENPVAAMCSAHYFTLENNIVAQGWYEQGTRFLDVSNAEKIRQIGYYFLPTSATWAAHFAPTDPTKSTVYVLDASHGIDVLKITRPEKGKRSAPFVACNTAQCERNHKPDKVVADILASWSAAPPDLGLSDSRFGYACRLTYDIDI
jgi:LVIVD repeat